MSRFVAAVVTVTGQLVHAQVHPELGDAQTAAWLAAKVREARERRAAEVGAADSGSS